MLSTIIKYIHFFLLQTMDYDLYGNNILEMHGNIIDIVMLVIFYVLLQNLV